MKSSSDQIKPKNIKSVFPASP